MRFNAFNFINEPDPPYKRNLTIPKVAKILGVSRQAVYYMIHTGKIIPIFEGKVRRITRDELRRYLREKLIVR